MTERLGRNPFSSKAPAQKPAARVLSTATRTPSTVPRPASLPRSSATGPMLAATQAGLVTLTRDLATTIGFIAIGLSASILAAFHRTWIPGKA